MKDQNRCVKVMVVGSGGREHALCWALTKSPMVEEVLCVPGNAGIAQIARCIRADVNDHQALIQLARQNGVAWVVIGPEAPLAAGIADDLEDAGLVVFGPRRAAAQLESSKVFAKQFMQRRRIPSASFEVFEHVQDALGYVAQARYPLVVKADGLAAGKGVFVCATHQEAQEALVKLMQERVFNEAGERVIIEECLTGEEASVMAVCDGEDFVLLAPAQDHKRVFDDDLGPNTGGMGAYSPTPILDDETLNHIAERIIAPTLKGMVVENNPFRGVLYAGLMLTKEGPFVLEFNVRFGDPEAQAVLPRLRTDFGALIAAACEGRLKNFSLEWDSRVCVCVVMCSGGYPGSYETGKPIHGLDEVAAMPNVFVFHAGTVQNESGEIVTSGGRVLGVSALGDGWHEAIKRAYEAVDKISFDHCFFRRDIGAKALKYLGTRSRITSHI